MNRDGAFHVVGKHARHSPIGPAKCHPPGYGDPLRQNLPSTPRVRDDLDEFRCLPTEQFCLPDTFKLVGGNDGQQVGSSPNSVQAFEYAIKHLTRTTRDRYSLSTAEDGIEILDPCRIGTLYKYLVANLLEFAVYAVRKIKDISGQIQILPQ